MPTDNSLYTASDFIGKTLIAYTNVPVYDYAYDGATQTGVIKPGQSVGVVFSYLDANPDYDRSVLYWQFVSSSGKYYYTKMLPGLYSKASLESQGILTDQQKLDAAAEAKMSDFEKAIKKYFPMVIIGAIGIAAVQGYFSRPQTK
jgi:hypothetical protein